MFENTIYIKVFCNRFELRHIESNQSLSASSLKPFTTERLLIGQFSLAESLLRSELKKLTQGKWLIFRPNVLIHPMEKTQGGLCEIEERIFKELALGAGAKKVAVWIGHALSDQEIRTMINAL